MKPFRLAALSLALLTAFSLTGCDDSGTPQASAPAPAADSNPGATAKPDRAQLAALAKKDNAAFRAQVAQGAQAQHAPQPEAQAQQAAPAQE